jgi:hypothetical protein
MDDRLRADRTGSAQIVLTDNTRIVIGPGAQVDVNDFVYNSDGTFESITVRATKGAFRFISGKSASSAYRIETPSGTIGVRGTAFDVGITNGQTHVVMVRGTVEMCPRTGGCQVLRGMCNYGVMNTGRVEVEGDLRRKARADKANFPLMWNEKVLRPQFRQSGDCTPDMTVQRVQRRAATEQNGREKSREPQLPDKTPCGRC